MAARARRPAPPRTRRAAPACFVASVRDAAHPSLAKTATPALPARGLPDMEIVGVSRSAP